MPRDSTHLLLAAVAACCAVGLVVFLLRWIQFRTATARDVTREERARLREQKQVRDVMHELLAELQSTAERVEQRIDAKLAQLDAAVQDIDARLSPRDSTTIAPGPRPSSPAAAESARRAVRPRLAADDASPRSARATPAEARRAERQRLREALAQAAQATATAAAPTAGDPRVRAARDLIQQRVPLPRVAEQSGLPLGEVEVLADLARLAHSALPTPGERPN